MHFTPHKPKQTSGMAFLTQSPFECKPITKTPTSDSMSSDPIKDLTTSMEATDLIGGKHQTNTLIQICIRAQNKVFFFACFNIQRKSASTLVARVIRRAKPILINNLRDVYTYINPNSNHFTDEVKEEEVEPKRPSTPAEEDPMARAPTPDIPTLTPPNLTPQPLETQSHHASTPINHEIVLPHSQPPAIRVRLDSECSGVSVSSRVCPKDKGDRAPLSEQARRNRREKESSKRRLKRRELNDQKRKPDPEKQGGAKPQEDVAVSHPVEPGNPNTKHHNSNNNNNPPNNPPVNPTQNPSTTPSLRSPGEVYGVVNPRFTVLATRPGAGAETRSQIIRALLFAPEDYSVGQLFTATDGMSFGVEDDNSLRVVREVLEAEGLTVVITPVWNRYTFHVPQQYEFFRLEELVRALTIRNSRRSRGPEGLPDDALRGVSAMEEGGEEGSSQPRRVRVWVDVSPEGEQYLTANDHLLRIVDSAVRLRPATNSRPAPDRS